MTPRILLITPLFYGLETRIKTELENLGFDVVWIENRSHKLDYHGTNSKLKLIRKAYYLFFSPRKKYLRKAFKKIYNLKFDLLLSINANAICPYALKVLKRNNPKLDSVLFLWDSSKMFNWTKEAKLFKKVYSFDHDDCCRFGFEYKPNFFINTIPVSGFLPEIDLLFTGKFSFFRINMIDKILSIAEESEIKFFARIWPDQSKFFHSDLIYNLLKILRVKTCWAEEYIMRYEAFEGKLKRDYFISDYLDLDEVKQLTAKSKVVLDLPYSHQSGYSHRLIDALANGKKVITTNKRLRDESYFNPEQIHILDPVNPEIDAKWIKEPKQFYPNHYFNDYVLTEWLKSIFYNVAK